MTGPRFLWAVSEEYIDPGFDFLRERYRPDRQPQRTDVYPHEFFPRPPYDGLLLSRSLVGDARHPGKLSREQRERLLREGVVRFLRYDPGRWDGMLLGDSGAFAYRDQPQPPYTVPELVDYYVAAGFTHALSLDHVVLGYDARLDAPPDGVTHVPAEWRRRADLTLHLAQEFAQYCRQQQAPFQPIGVVQGWSPGSYRDAARALIGMGYDSLALGSLVPRKVPQLHAILQAVREAAPPPVRLHLLGFMKMAQLAEFLRYEITSFDSTAPMLRAFKDRRHNYLGRERWYTAIRVPQSQRPLRRRTSRSSSLILGANVRTLESRALRALRRYARQPTSLAPVLTALRAYRQVLGLEGPAARERETLSERPWETCDCRACREAGVEVLIYRGANRNRRRSFHNLEQFYRRLCALRAVPPQPPADQL
jgi:hypothetical protein